MNINMMCICVQNWEYVPVHMVADLQMHVMLFPRRLYSMCSTISLIVNDIVIVKRNLNSANKYPVPL